MRDDQLFGVIASVALLVWLLGRGVLPGPRRRRQAELAAFGLIAARHPVRHGADGAVVCQLKSTASAERADAEQPRM